jgi:hypothetical protein
MEQAKLEGVPFSVLERRMLYITEPPEAVEDFVALNKEFDKAYSTEEYEAKVTRLLENAHARLSKRSASASLEWDAAVYALKNGNHYLVALWNQVPAKRSAHDSLKLLLSGLLLAAILGVAIFFTNKFGMKSPLAQRVILYPLIVLLAFGFVKLLGKATPPKL